MHDHNAIAADRRPPQAPRRLVVRAPASLSFPKIDPISPLALRSKALETFCRTACRSSAQSLKRLLRDLPHAESGALAPYPGLDDELSPYLGNLPTAVEEGSAKAREEFAVYLRLVDWAESIPNLSRDDFTELLLEIHRRLGVGVNVFRRGPVRTRPDVGGNRVVYPNYGRCLSLIADLHAFTHAHIRQFPALCGAVIYVGINHAHPFTDGNGRTARTAYNLVMAASGSRHFLPIYCFSRLAGGSLIIKVRRAMYDGDWDALLAFLADASRLSDRLQTER